MAKYKKIPMKGLKETLKEMKEAEKYLEENKIETFKITEEAWKELNLLGENLFNKLDNGLGYSNGRKDGVGTILTPLAVKGLIESKELINITK